MSAAPRPVRVTACANIALIKYWGKADAVRNVPAVGSLSLTLDGLVTETTIAPRDGEVTFALDGAPMREDEAARIRDAARALGAPMDAGWRFETRNRFPTAAGLASSASGGAAAVTALMAAFDLDVPAAQTHAVTLQLSGSAPRSLYGGFVRLDPGDDGVRLKPLAMPAGWDLRVLVVTVAAGRKAVSSREAMHRTEASPYWPAWVASHKADLDAAEAAIADGDFERLVTVMEANTRKMHALIWTAEPAVWYLSDITWRVLAAVREARAGGLHGGYTMDAGPHVKVFVPADEVDAWQGRLAEVPGVHQVLVSRAGAAPQISEPA